jgi:hypothetical protein
MAELSDVLVYICLHYPYKDDLSKTRLTKIAYLADWKSAIERDQQITNIRWEFNHYGPYVDDVIETARNDLRFEIVLTRNYYGEPKEVIRVREGVAEPAIDPGEKVILDFIIKKSSSKNWGDFINLVYSTYPIITQLRFSEIDLVSLAREYNQVKPIVKPMLAS